MGGSLATRRNAPLREPLPKLARPGRVPGRQSRLSSHGAQLFQDGPQVPVKKTNPATRGESHDYRPCLYHSLRDRRKQANNYPLTVGHHLAGERSGIPIGRKANAPDDTRWKVSTSGCRSPKPQQSGEGRGSVGGSIGSTPPYLKHLIRPDLHLRKNDSGRFA
jgi:hypothetical protein